MGTVVTTCPFVPREWIAAHGLTPRRVMPSASHGQHVAEGACPFMGGFLAMLQSGPAHAGIVMTTVCDQMRRGHDLLAREERTPHFLMNIPSTWQTTAARGLYMSELKRLSAFLVACGGTAPSADTLAHTMTVSDTQRSALRDAESEMYGRPYSEAIAEFNRTGRFTVTPCERPAKAPRVALIGGPLLEEHMPIFDIIATRGGSVVLDATETGIRTLSRPFDRRRIKDDPLEELCDAYFGSIPDVSRRPNSGLYTWLKRELPSRGIQGAILVRQLWCDLWHAETARLKAWLDIPLLDLDLDVTGMDSSSTTRIEAFLEMLS